MKHFRWAIASFVLVLLLTVTATPSKAQDDAPPVDDEFVTALVMMSVNHNMMQGQNEVRDLSALSQYVDEYYAGLAAAATDENTRFSINFKRSALISRIQDRINVSTGLQIMDTIMDVFSGDENWPSQSANARQAVSGLDDDYDPSTDYFTVMNSLIMTDGGALIKLKLGLDIVTTMPSMAPAVSDSTAWSINPAAITSSTAGIQPAGGDPGASPADETSPVGDSSAGTGSSSSDDSSAGAGSNAADCSALRPLRFNNTGFDAATVRVASFQPASGCSTSTPGASTVVFPDSSSAAYLELPIGTYTFCYEWELGDVDYDGTTDYHHRSTSSYTITSDSSTNPDSASVVTISPDSSVSNPNGRCSGEVPVGSGSSNTSGLTPEEAANQGTHSFLVSCSADWCAGESFSGVLSLDFSAGVLTIHAPETGTTEVASRTAPNQYSYSSEDGPPFLLNLNMNGFTISGGGIEGGSFVYTRQ